MNNNDNKITTGCVTVYPKCIVWNLGPIPCIGIKTGDTLDEITFAITKKICEISQPFDLSTVSAQCLKDKLNINLPLNKTISTYLQLIIDNECTILDLITTIQSRLDGITNPILNLNLRCLQPIGPNGNPLSYSVETVLQLLINESCAVRDSIAGLTGAIALVNQRIDNLPTPYVEPSIISCLYTGTRPLNQSVLLLASDYCSYRTKLGTLTNLDTAIGRQCTGLNTFFSTNVNFIQNPVSIADTINNQWITICSLLARISTLEDCACKKGCDDIKIGFITIFNDNNTVTLKFTTGAGTTIPTGIIECGSILTIKNDTGTTTLPISVIVAQNGSSVDIDISMFQQGEYLTFDLNSKLCGNGLTCEKCTSKVVRNTSGCCEIVNSGTVPITITYKTCGINALP